MVKKGYVAAGALYVVVVLSLGCATAANLQQSAVQSGYAPVNGLKMYYEVHGRANGKIPPLVMIGDHDIVRPEHAVQMFRLLPNAQLALLPGTDHMTIVNRADWLVPMIETFLDSPMPPTRSNGNEKR